MFVVWLILFKIIPSLLYILVGYGYFYKAKEQIPVSKGRVTYSYMRTLAGDWDNYERSPSLYKKPKETLGAAWRVVNQAEVDAYKLRFYRRAMLSPIWPLMFIWDFIGHYRDAKTGAKLYYLEESTKNLKKLQEQQEELKKKQQEAVDAMEGFK